MTKVPFEGMRVLVDASDVLRGGDPMDPDDCLNCEVIGPAKGLQDLRVMWGNPARGAACTFDVSLSDVIPIQDNA